MIQIGNRNYILYGVIYHLGDWSTSAPTAGHYINFIRQVNSNGVCLFNFITTKGNF